MSDDSKSAKSQKTSISPMLSVRRGAKAIGFYKAALGAAELSRIESETGEVVAQLSVRTAEFWLADESPARRLTSNLDS